MAPTTKNLILDSAKTLFAKRGYEGVSVRDIASTAKVAVSAINYHFESKETLFLKIVESFATEKLEAATAILSPAKSTDDFTARLEIFADTLTLALLRDLPLFQLIQHEVEKRSPLTKPIVDGTIRIWLESLNSFFSAARAKKILSRETNIELLSTVFLREIVQTVRNDDWRTGFNKKSLTDSKHRRSWIQSLIHILLCGALNEDARDAKTRKRMNRKFI